MKLTDLDATFIRSIDERTNQMYVSMSEAQGVQFQCPLCAKGKPVEEENGERFVRGVHYVLCWFPNAPSNRQPLPRWTPSGTGLHDLTLQPSIQILGDEGCKWHGFVTNGNAE
jgi:hypothetical protein